MRLVVTILVFVLSPIACADGPPEIALQTDDGLVVGRLLNHNDDTCWVVESDGRLEEVERDQVTRFARTGESFRPLTVPQVRASLADEFEAPYTVVADQRYVVVADEAIASDCLAAFSEIDRAFRTYFSRRVIELETVEFPLVAIVFRDHDDFVEYAANEDVEAREGLVGYYLRSSNRVALYDPGASAAETVADLNRGADRASRNAVFRIDASETLDPVLYDTIVHEATHQMAFNTGLHKRVGDEPLWVIEGLATMFEAPGLRRRQSPERSVDARVNHVRLDWFREHVAEHYEPGRIAEMIASDDYFEDAALDAYATAWALTFFLNETRSPSYSRYLRIMRDRAVGADYDAGDRIADFQTAFGQDISRLEVEMLRFMAELDFE